MFLPSTSPVLDSRFYIGLDLGQRSDPAAIAIVQYYPRPTGRDHATYQNRYHAVLRVRHLTRIPLGSSYPAIANIVRATLRNSEFQSRPTLVVDATGPGLPFLDFFTANSVEASLVKLVITASGTPTESSGFHYVSRTILLNNLATLFQTRSLTINPKLPSAQEAINEITALDLAGHSTAPHDDLAIAVSLAVWQANKIHRLHKEQK
ncbi:MAG: hypothetical protein HY820_03305 [Acidobacteria bacterium]|nr:hypothetical protein [Acidobacteriota bacterium]